MTLRILGFSFLSFALGALLFATITSRASIQDDRAADREAIRAHIDSIFQAFIKRDAAALRATHAQNWLGYLEGSRTMIKGVHGYREWNDVDQKILNGAVEFAKSGGKLVKLDFPKTEIQVYGATAVVYSNYAYELETGGQHINQSGRVTEVFVLRKGQWVNPGWHMDSGK